MIMGEKERDRVTYCYDHPNDIVSFNSRHEPIAARLFFVSRFGLDVYRRCFIPSLETNCLCFPFGMRSKLQFPFEFITRTNFSTIARAQTRTEDSNTRCLSNFKICKPEDSWKSISVSSRNAKIIENNVSLFDSPVRNKTNKKRERERECPSDTSCNSVGKQRGMPTRSA